VSRLYVVSRQPLSGKLLNERGEVPASLLRYSRSIQAQGLEHVIDRVLPVKVLPQVNAGWAQTESLTRIGVEDDGPVVKLLTEHDQRVGYGFFTVFHGSTVPFLDSYPPDRALPDRGRMTAKCNPRTREPLPRIPAVLKISIQGGSFRRPFLPLCAGMTNETFIGDDLPLFFILI
jgi:hypothetical protein